MAIDLHPNAMLDFAVREGHDVKELVQNGLSKVPERYIQVEHERIAFNSNVDVPAPQFPVVDLSGLDGPQHNEVVAAIVKAAKGFGFCQVVNHGLSVEFLNELQDSTRYFFNQPMEKKALYRKGASPSASVAYGTTSASEVEKVFDWVDTLTMTYKNDEDALTHWPEPCKELVLKYIKTSIVLAKRILQFLMANIGVKLDHTEIETYMGDKMTTVNFYPPCPEPDLTNGLGRHSDFGTITVLLQDDVGGLFVKLENDAEHDATWVEIKPIPGALLIILGDSLEILSNGEYQSPEHWVRTSSTKSRISIPVFLTPILTSKIAPLPKVAEKDGGARYKESMFGEYLGYAYTQPARGKAILNSMKIAQSQ